MTRVEALTSTNKYKINIKLIAYYCCVVPYLGNGHYNTPEGSQIFRIAHWGLQSPRESNVDIEAVPITLTHLP